MIEIKRDLFHVNNLIWYFLWIDWRKDIYFYVQHEANLKIILFSFEWWKGVSDC